MEELIKKIGKKAVWQILSKIITVFLSLISTFLIIRLLGPKDYGLFSLINTIIPLFQSFTCLGIEKTIPYFFQKYKNQRKSLLNKFLKIRLSLITIGGLILFFSSNLIADFYGIPELSFYLKLISFFAPFFVLMNDSFSIIQGLNDIKKLMQTEVLFHVTKFLAIILIVIGLNLTGSIIGFGLSYVITTFFAFKYIFSTLKDKKEFTKGSLWRKFIITFMLIGFLSYSSNYLINLFLGGKPLELGYFNSISKLGIILSIIPVGLSTALLPNITNKSKKEINFISRKFLKYTFIFLCFCVAIFLAIPNFVINFFLGADYKPVINFFHFMLIGLSIQVISNIYLAITEGLGKPKNTLINQLIKVIIILIFSSSLINAYNASIVFLISRLVSFFYLLIKLNSYVKHSFKDYIKTLVFITPLFFSLYLDYNLLFKVLSTIMSLLFFIITTYYVTFDSFDKELLNKLVKKTIRYIK